MPIIISLVIIAVIVLFVIAQYNSLVTLKNRVKNAWSQIDVQLQKRYDLIPNLVETVKGYASHESETFEKVVSARNLAMTSTTPAEAIKNENVLTGTLRSLFAISENYPDLKANTNFLELQASLEKIEQQISVVRMSYNDTTTIYNTEIEKFPKNIIANIFGFKEYPLYEVESDEVKVAPKVKF
ncbi:MAG: LemA family protein [Culicoidibacterales bacterium]